MPEETSFEDIVFRQGLTFCPNVCADGENRVLIAHFGGRITHVNLVDKKTLAEAFSSAVHGLACNVFRSLSFEPQHRLAAVAAEGYAFIWAVDTREIMKLRSHHHGCVNCLAFSLDGRFLALGIGRYPLDTTSPVQARIELWSCQGWSYVGAITMPGVCVDGIFWTDDYRIVCTSGTRPQNQGFLAIIDGNTLQTMTFQSVPFVGIRTVFLAGRWDGEDLIVATHSHHVSAFPISDSYIAYDSVWQFDAGNENELLHSVLDKERQQIVLSSGAILRACDGVQVGQLDALPDCCCVAMLGSEKYVGVSTTGILRIWTLPAKVRPENKEQPRMT